jgi:hypothetical protein
MSWVREGTAWAGRREGKTAAPRKTAKRRMEEWEEAGVGVDMRVWERGEELPF